MMLATLTHNLELFTQVHIQFDSNNYYHDLHMYFIIVFYLQSYPTHCALKRTISFYT